MRFSVLIMLISAGTTVGLTRESLAQLSVQQPVFQSTGGYFAVTVPDRGGIVLGGFSRAGEFRRSYGFPCFRRSLTGRFVERSTFSAHVWIHDLREMDRLVLEMAETDSDRSHTSTESISRDSGIAWSYFEPRRGVTVESIPQRRSIVPSGRRHVSVGILQGSSNGSVLSTTKQSVSRSDVQTERNRALDPARNYRLGLEAEESGKLTVAKLHYQTAAQYGSEQAARRLRELGVQVVAEKPAGSSWLK